MAKMKPVDSGRLGALRRWGPVGTRVVKLGDLTTPQRRVVMALVDALADENQREQEAGDASRE